MAKKQKKATTTDQQKARVSTEKLTSGLHAVFQENKARKALEATLAVTPVIQMGLNMMALGVTLTNQDSKIRDIADAATKCGLEVRFRFVKPQQPGD